jgi:hypothetical protein
MTVYLVYYTNNAKYPEDDMTYVVKAFSSVEGAHQYVESMRNKRDQAYDEDSPNYGEFDYSDDWYINELEVES